MKQNELNKILELHKKWLNNDGGKRANLQGANLQRANLHDANLQRANLQGANLQRANLHDANLQGVSLQDANLQDANLQGANLQGAHLQRANLQGVSLDFSCLPLWCGGLNFEIDEKQAKQLMYHVINLMQYSDLDTSKIVKKNMYKWLSDSHLVTGHVLPILEDKEND